MANYENARSISAQALITNGVASCNIYRFVSWVNGGGAFQVANQVPSATGAAARGICSMAPDNKNVTNGLVATSVAVPDGGQNLIELGEAVTDITVPLRVGGNSDEVDGAAYLANASNDVIVAYPLALGAIGDIIPIEFVGYAGLIA